MKYPLGDGYVVALRLGSGRGGYLHDAPATLPEAPVQTVRRIRQGLPVAEFEALADWLEMSEDQLAPVLGISRTTLHRRKKTGLLDPSQSERLVRVARLLARACEVLGSEAAARDWLKAPSFAFPGESPLSFSDTEIGAKEVEDLLGRLEHGVFT